MQNLIALLLVLLAFVFILLRWMPAKWQLHLLQRHSWSKSFLKISAGSCSDQCKNCASDSQCKTSPSAMEKPIHLHRKSNTAS